MNESRENEKERVGGKEKERASERNKYQPASRKPIQVKNKSTE